MSWDFDEMIDVEHDLDATEQLIDAALAQHAHRARRGPLRWQRPGQRVLRATGTEGNSRRPFLWIDMIALAESEAPRTRVRLRIEPVPGDDFERLWIGGGALMGAGVAAAVLEGLWPGWSASWVGWLVAIGPLALGALAGRRVARVVHTGMTDMMEAGTHGDRQILGRVAVAVRAILASGDTAVAGDTGVAAVAGDTGVVPNKRTN